MDPSDSAPPRPRVATSALVEPILREVARSLLEEKSALFVSSSSSSTSSSSPSPSSSEPSAAAAPLLLRYPRDPRDADSFTSELSSRLLARLAALGLPCKWVASCSLAARGGGGTALAAAGVFEENEEGGETEEGGQQQQQQQRDSLCCVQVEEGGVEVTATAAWVRCL